MPKNAPAIHDGDLTYRIIGYLEEVAAVVEIGR